MRFPITFKNVKKKMSLRNKIKSATNCLCRAEMSKKIALEVLPFDLNTYKVYRSINSDKNKSDDNFSSKMESLGDSIVHMESAMTLLKFAINKHSNVDTEIDNLDHYIEVLKIQTAEVDFHFKQKKVSNKNVK